MQTSNLMKTYKSKISTGLIIALSGMLGGVFCLMVYDKNWPGIFTVSLTMLFIGHMIMTTYYQIRGSQLTIRSGFIVNKTVDINTITKVEAT